MAWAWMKALRGGTSPPIRTVNIDDATNADQIFNTLMGNEVPPRKAFIQAHAKSVKNLDI